MVGKADCEKFGVAVAWLGKWEGAPCSNAQGRAKVQEPGGRKDSWVKFGHIKSMGIFFSLINEDKYFNLFTYKIKNKDQKGLSELFLGQTRGLLLSLI